MGENGNKNYKQILIYLLFCIVCAASNWAVYILMTKALDVDLSEVGETGSVFLSLFSSDAGSNIRRLFVCTVTAWIVNVIVAFVTNKIWVFRSNEKSLKGIVKEFGSFLGGHLFTGALDWAGTPLLVMLGLNQAVFGIEGALAKFIISLLVMVLNFVIGKLLVFRKKT